MPSSSGPDFEGAYKRALAENHRMFDPHSSMKRIRSFAERAGVPASAIALRAEEDPIFRWAIVKDPKRQNVYEKEAARWLKALPSVTAFQTHRAAAVSGLTGPGSDVLARNVDFSWCTCSYRVYAAHTYTHDSGGMQGRQYDALHSFIGEANKSTHPGRIFIAIADGPFYGTKGERSNQTKIDDLQEHANRRTAFAGRSADVPAILSGLP